MAEKKTPKDLELEYEEKYGGMGEHERKQLVRSSIAYKRTELERKQKEEQEQKEFLEEMIAPNLYSMFVTPKDVDETVKYLSFTISEGLNIAFSEV